MKTGNVIPFLHPRRAREEMQSQACDWLARLDAGATPDDRERLAAWLDASPAHLAALLDMAALWDQADVLAELADIFPLERYAPPQDRRLRRGVLGVLAASLAAALFVVLTLTPVTGRRPPVAGNAIAAAPRVYETAIGEQLTAQLPDGSTVILNTNTRIELAFTSGVRNVHLVRGEGHFEVAKNPDWPFRVHAGRRVIEAVGTAFAVQHLENDSVAVTVTEGSVNLRRDGVAAAPAPAPAAATVAAAPAPAPGIADSIPLVAGEYAAIDEQFDSIERRRLQQEEIEVELSWRHGMLLFQDDPLGEVLLEVSRYTPIRIEVDEAIRDTKVKGYYRAGDVEAMLVALETNFDLKVERLGADRVRLSSRP